MFKRIPGHPDYLIGEDGVVISLKNNKRRVLKTRLNKYGYYRVLLDGKDRTIHRLLAMTFIDNYYNYPLVLHKNDIKTDNRLENLYWGTVSQNKRDSVRNNRCRGLSNKRKAEIVDYYFSHPGLSIKEIAKIWKINRTTLERTIFHSYRYYMPNFVDGAGI